MSIGDNMEKELVLYMVFFFIRVFSGYIFIFETANLQLKLKKKTNHLFFYIVFIALILSNTYIYMHISWVNELGWTTRYAPDTFEDFMVMLFMFFLFQETAGKRIFYISFGYMMTKGIYIIYSLFHSIVFQYVINLVNNYTFMLLLDLIFPVMYKLLFLLLNKKKMHFDLHPKEWWIFSSLSFILLFYCYFVIDFMPNVDPDNLFLYASIDYILIIFVIGIYVVFLLYLRILNKQRKELMELKLKEQALSYRKELTVRMEAAIQENSKLKHDLNNHFLILESMMKEDPNKALAYLQTLREKVEIVSTASTTNIYLNYLIDQKAASAHASGINFTCICQNALTFLNIFELTTIFGNLLDNALEAQQYVTGNKFIKLSITNKKDGVSIIIKNSCNASNILMEKRKLMTNKKDTQYHGIGYQRVGELIEELQGAIRKEVQENAFVVIMKLPLPDVLTDM